MDNVEIRPLTKEDLATMERWARTACWWDNENTLFATWTECKGHWLGVFLGNNLVGSLALCPWREVTTAGYLTVDKEHRHQRYASRLITEAKRLHGVNGCITAVNRLLPMYKKYIPELVESFQVVSALFVTNSALNEKNCTTKWVLKTLNVSHAEEMSSLIRYDSSVHSEQRVEFLNIWCDPAHAKTIVASNNGNIVGYGCIQPVFGGAHKVGPLFADEPEVAISIFRKLLEQIPGGSQVALSVIFREECPMVNELRKEDIKEEYKLTRLYQSFEPNLAADKVFALTDCGISIC